MASLGRRARPVMRFASKQSSRKSVTGRPYLGDVILNSTASKSQQIPGQGELSITSPR